MYEASSEQRIYWKNLLEDNCIYIAWYHVAKVVASTIFNCSLVTAKMDGTIINLHVEAFREKNYRTSI